MTIGLIRERKDPPDKRVALTPEHCKKAQDRFPPLKIIVESSNIRAFSDEEYNAEGLEVRDDISSADVLIGVKEVPEESLIPGKTYLFFSHTIKAQPYNRDLLRSILRKKIRLIDHETLTYENGSRVLGFGRYAGIVGAYNGILAWGLKTSAFELKPAHKCKDRAALEIELGNIDLPGNFKILLTGSGRVAGGVVEILECANIEKISPAEFLQNSTKGRVYCQLEIEDYYRTGDGGQLDKAAFYNDPTGHESILNKYAQVADMYVSGHFWDARAPVLLSADDLEKEDHRLQVVADISCDIAGPIACTIRASTIQDPIYGYHRHEHRECDPMDPNAIVVMAVDNLPCELPRDASEGFGEALLEFVVPELVNEPSDMLDRASITANGQLTRKFEYLREFVAG